MKTATYAAVKIGNHSEVHIVRNPEQDGPIVAAVLPGMQLAQRIAKLLNRNPGGLFIGDDVNPTDPFGPRIYANVQTTKGHYVADVTIHCHVSRGCVGKVCNDGCMFLEGDIVPLAVQQACKDNDDDPANFVRGGVGNVYITKEEWDAWMSERNARPKMA